jgi:polysaccharide biosynthesis transport protein
MVQPTVSTPPEPEVEYRPSAQMAYSLMRLVLAVRYRKNLVAAVMGAAMLLGWLYYATAVRLYAAKAAMLVTQTRPDRLDTSITNEESLRQNTMPTFENMVRSAKVLEGALKNLAPADRIDLADMPKECWVTYLQGKLSAKAIRATSILEVSYRSKDPQVAVHVVQAVVQSYLDFMDRMHKGTAGEISRMLTKEREEQAEKLTRKQEELLEARRHFADMGFRSDGKTLHPMVQRAVYFNDALIAAQKKRVEYEALLATIQTATANGEDLGQYLMSVGDVVGREMLLSSLGLGARDANTQAGLEQSLLADRAELQSIQQNLGPNHPEVVALAQRVRTIEQFLASAQERIGQRVAELGKSQLGPWLAQMVRQKLEGARKEEAILQARFEETRTEAISLSGQLAQIEMLERDVKRLSDMNDVLLNQIASLDLKQNGQDVRVAVIEEPVAATSPVSPKLRLTALLALLGGLGASLGLVTLLDAMDDRFRSVEEMQSRLGLPILAMIHRLEPPASAGLQALVTHATPTSTASESFRTLRTALTLTHTDARQIVVTSAEPGDGKTTTLANLAVCYAQAGKRTLLIDADLRRPGLTGLMDMRGPNGLSEVLRSELEVGQVAAKHIRRSGLEGLDVLPSGPRPSDPAELLSSPRFSQLLAWAEAAYDLILVDSPPTLATTDTAIIGRLVDGVILVVQPAKNRRRLVTRVVERLDLMKIAVLGLVVNRTGSEEDSGYYGYHSYGYGAGAGYGYGYGYGENADYGHEEPSTAATTGAAQEECIPFAEERKQDHDQEEESRALLVPRRVA